MADVVGLFELLGGLAVAVGVLTRLAAFLSAVLMFIAYWVAHPAIIPIMNGGELASLYFIAFLLITAYGSQKWSLERAVLKREL